MELESEALADPCPIRPVVDLVFGRWTSHILCALQNGEALRFSDVQARMPFITPKVLTERLRHLERNGFIRRKMVFEPPRRVEYEATPLAASLLPVFESIIDWSNAHLDEVRMSQRSFDRRSRLIS